MNIGDIVKFKNDIHTLFMIVDRLDSDLELMQIYPMSRESKYATANIDDMVMHARHSTKGCESTLKLLARDRERKGWYGEPDYMRESKANRKEEEKIRSVTRLPERLDKVDYFGIRTIDEGLDVLRDLNALIENFGDEEYIRMKEAVLDLLKFMVELKQEKKKK